MIRHLTPGEDHGMDMIGHQNKSQVSGRMLLQGTFSVLREQFAWENRGRVGDAAAGKPKT